MPAAPVIGAIVDFSNGVPFITNNFILDDPVYGALDFGQLTDTAINIVDITNSIVNVSIRRGRNRILNKFEAGTANVTIYDQNGDWNPSNPSGAYYGDLKPLRKIQVYADYNGTRYYIFSGFITDYDTSFNIGTEEVSRVTLKCVDAFRLLQGAQVTTVTGAPAGQLSGARVNALLNATDWPSGLRDIDTGQSTLQADPGTARTALQALRTVEDSEFGGIFLDAEGRVTFIDRDQLTTSLASPLYDFSDDGTGIAFQNAVTAFDDTLIVNDVTVTRLGGSPQNVFSQPSIDTYFIHSGVREGILVQTDSEALDQASMLLSTRKDTETRIDSIQLNLEDGNDTTRCTAGLAIELLDCVTVKKAMPGNTSIQQTLLVQGLSHDFNNRKMTTTVYTGESLITGFVLDSASLGILDTSVLGY
jgi:hypothetical protein